MFLDKLTSIFGYPVSPERKLGLAKRETERIAVAEEELEKQRLLALHKRYVGSEELERMGDKPGFSDILTFDLGIARDNVEIWSRGGKCVFITNTTGASNATQLRFNNKASSLYDIYPGYILGAFRSIFLKNTAQAGKSLSIVVGYRDQADYQMLRTSGITMVRDSTGQILNPAVTGDITALKNIIPLRATAPTIYNVTLTLADTEYSQVIPNGTKIIRANLTNLATFRYAWVTGKVAVPTAPYGVQVASRPLEYHELNFSGKTLYFADSVGGQIMMIECIV